MAASDPLQTLEGIALRVERWELLTTREQQRMRTFESEPRERRDISQAGDLALSVAQNENVVVAVSVAFHSHAHRVSNLATLYEKITIGLGRRKLAQVCRPNVRLPHLQHYGWAAVGVWLVVAVPLMLASLGLLGEQPVVRGSSAVALLASALGFFWLVVRRFAVRSDMTLLELQETLLRSKNDAWRDDAAELIAELYWQDDAAEGVLVEAMNSDLLDDSLRRTCLESIAEIWIRRGAINTETYDQFVGGPSQVILDAWITASGLKT